MKPGRLRRHAVVDVSRSRQRRRTNRWCGSTARHAHGQAVRSELPRRLDQRGPDRADEARVRLAPSLRREPRAGRAHAHRHRPRRSSATRTTARARRSPAMTRGRRPEPVVRLQDALHQPADRRRRDPDHEHLHAAAPGTASTTQALSRDRQHGIRAGRRHRHDDGSATRRSTGNRTTSSWCRAG